MPLLARRARRSRPPRAWARRPARRAAYDPEHAYAFGLRQVLDGVLNR
jgi:hypothetical protein